MTGKAIAGTGRYGIEKSAGKHNVLPCALNCLKHGLLSHVADCLIVGFLPAMPAVITSAQASFHG
jgi:hypothetical protein